MESEPLKPKKKRARRAKKSALGPTTTSSDETIVVEEEPKPEPSPKSTHNVIVVARDIGGSRIYSSPTFNIVKSGDKFVVESGGTIQEFPASSVLSAK